MRPSTIYHNNTIHKFSGGPGCWYSNGFPEDNGKWRAAQYTKILPSTLNQRRDFSKVPMTIRHKDDPYIFAVKNVCISVDISRNISPKGLYLLDNLWLGLIVIF
jgi:hypothetical protein